MEEERGMYSEHENGVMSLGSDPPPASPNPPFPSRVRLYRTRKMMFAMVSVPLKHVCAEDSSGDACDAELNSKP